MANRIFWKTVHNNRSVPTMGAFFITAANGCNVMLRQIAFDVAPPRNPGWIDSASPFRRWSCTGHRDALGKNTFKIDPDDLFRAKLNCGLTETGFPVLEA
ncbi:MAG: hypothetical protein ACU826_10260 [Gammaproteobacteria bacterium]